ncbi:amino acid ABC transporter permease/ATP-binding protein [Clavibacter sp. VKM Ac-2542]|uniref:amino acid ABC transporter permease/ATP-binding protein n=1 Tax=Clavibacter sp. VKM Ac-2542 TaxID=2783811 RepID=UPI00188A71FB|nr:amino acid ABC transporter permease/ATP-binding protein [Clavibacter sp. VKM Ac-2542]MBF4620805.1 amino acid ABC transporter permease/ATP-binding protein [Clavibacter sp. VKM Ac-2542]
MDHFLHYLTLPYLLQGIGITAQLTLYGFVGGLLVGGVLAAMQLSRFRALAVLARAYTVIYRGTPLILQLVFVFTALPHMGIVLSPIAAGALALALNEAAFFAEILRSGVRGVDAGQTAAARALGMVPRVVMRRVVGPQAARSMVPALGNEAVSTMKNSALASIIAVPELTLRSQQLASSTFEYFSIYFASAVMYLLLTGIITVTQLLVEDAADLDRTHRRSFLSRLVPRRRDRAAASGGADAGGVAAVDPVAEAAVASPGGAARAGSADPAARVPGPPIVELRGVRKSYGRNEVLRGIDLTIRAGEVIALLGPSGSGKSTLLRTVNRLETVDSGEVLLAGRYIGLDASGRPAPEAAVAAQRVEAGVGMVFQQFNLFHHLTAAQNVAAPLRWVAGMDPAAAEARARELLDGVGLAARADVLPRHLSGGQQQRVGIARALAGSPRVLLLDEPTSALDPELVAEVLAVIRGLAHTEGLTMLIATHQMRFARDVADRVVFMAGGVVVEDGPARQVIDAPRDPVTARFVNAMNQAES